MAVRWETNGQVGGKSLYIKQLGGWRWSLRLSYLALWQIWGAGVMLVGPVWFMLCWAFWIVEVEMPFIPFCACSHLMVIRVYVFLFELEPLFTVLRELYGVLGIEPESAACKTYHYPFIASYYLSNFYFINHLRAIRFCFLILWSSSVYSGTFLLKHFHVCFSQIFHTNPVKWNWGISLKAQNLDSICMKLHLCILRVRSFCGFNLFGQVTSRPGNAWLSFLIWLKKND